MRWDGAYGKHVSDEKGIQHFGSKTQGKIPLGRPWCRCEDNIRMDLRV